MSEGQKALADLARIAPELVVLLTAVGALVLEMVRRPKWALGWTLSGLWVALAFAALGDGAAQTVFHGTFRVDLLERFARWVLIPSTAACALLAWPETRDRPRAATFQAILSFGLLGALLLAGAGDAMFLVLGILMTSLAAFPLVAFFGDARGTEAAMKYFIFGSVTGAVMVFGLTFWFGVTGSTLLSGLGDAPPSWAVALGWVCVLVGLGYKAGLAPLHFWAPDAYEGGPLPVAAFLSVVPKIGAVFALAQAARSFPPHATAIRGAVALVAALSMSWGNLAALTQTNVVRLFAYSSIAQAGYLLLGVVALPGPGEGLSSLAMFAAAYAVMNLGAFAVIARIGRELPSFEGLGRRRPVLAVGMVVLLLSLVGVPPLAGFTGKLLLFAAALHAGFGWLAVVGVLNSVLSLAVYLRIVVPMYGRGENPRQQTGSALYGGVAAVAVAATVVLGLGAELLLAIAR